MDAFEGEGGVAVPPVAVLLENRRAFLAFVERRVGDRVIAEDILQEAFARGLDRIETLRVGESVVAWFYRTFAYCKEQGLLVRVGE